MLRIFKTVMCILMLASNQINSQIAYKNVNGTLTSFPHDLSNNVVSIKIKFATFTTIDFIESFPALTRLRVTDGFLEEFPDLSNLTSTLEVLSLRGNKISVINFIPPMSALSEILLGGNFLKHLPDFTNVSSTLRILHLKNNYIIIIDGIPNMPVLLLLNLENNTMTNFPDLHSVSTSLTVLLLHHTEISVIPNNLVSPLVALTTLKIGTSSGDPMTLPNVCLMGRNVNVLTLIMYSEYISCDWTAVYVKLAERAGRLVITQDGVPPPKCASPTALAERNFSDVTMDELLHQNSKCYIRYVACRLGCTSHYTIIN